MGKAENKQESKVSKALLSPLMRHFRIPDTVEDNEVNAFLADYESALDKFGEETLRKAASDITVSRTTRTLPTIAECYRACQDAYNEIASKDYEPRGETLPPDHPESHARWELADKLIVCELGRQACDEGWQAALWGWIRKHGRLPNPKEAKVIRQRSNGDQQWIAEALEQAEKTYGPKSDAFKQLTTARRAMENRKADIKSMVYSKLGKGEAA